MEYRVTWSPEAVEDLESIAEYIEKDSPYYARSVVSKILTVSKKVREFPLIGRKVPDTSPYAKLINDNTIYIDYLLANFSKAMGNKELLKISDQNKLKRYTNVFTEEKIKALGL